MACRKHFHVTSKAERAVIEVRFTAALVSEPKLKKAKRPVMDAPATSSTASDGKVTERYLKPLLHRDGFPHAGVLFFDCYPDAIREQVKHIGRHTQVPSVLVRVLKEVSC